MKILIPFIILGVLFSCTSKQKNNQILDHADLFTESQEDSLYQLINQLDKTIGSEVAVITVDTLTEEINDFAINEFERLNLGRDYYNDGVLIVVAEKNKEIKIEVGKGLNEVIPYEIASRISREVIAPRFRELKYGLGVYNGIDIMKNAIEMNSQLIRKGSEKRERLR